MGGGLKLCLGFLEEGPHRRYYGTGDRTVACTPSPALYTQLGFEEDTQAAAPAAWGSWRKDPTGPRALETRLGQPLAQGGGRARTPGDPEGGLRAPATGH